MLLSEIKLNIKTSPHARSYTTLKSADLIGNGIQTMVYAHKKYPNSVLRVSAVEGVGDPLAQFLRVCVNHPNNPYLLKIHSYKLVPASAITYDEAVLLKGMGADIIADGAPFYLISVVEKLQSANDAAVYDAMERMGIHLDDFTLKPNDIGTAFYNKIKRRKMYEICTDPQFRAALRLLEPLFTKFIPDLHGDNFMLRGTQLVIIDPVM